MSNEAEGARAARAGPLGRRSLLLLFLLALAARALVAGELSRSVIFDAPCGDGAASFDWASDIAAGSLTGGTREFLSPLYAYWIAPVLALGQGAAGVRALQALQGALACALLAAGTTTFLGRRAGVLAGAGLALYAPAVFWDASFEKTGLDVLLASALVWALGRAQRDASAFVALGAGLFCGLLAVNRDNALLLAPLLFWSLAVRGGGRARQWRAAVLALLGVLVPLGPVSLRSAAVGEGFTFGRGQAGVNFYLGNHARADGLYTWLEGRPGSAATELLDATEIAERERGRSLSRAEVSSYWWARAWDWIAAEPAAAGRLLARKLYYTLHAREWMDTLAFDAARAESPTLRILSRGLDFGWLMALAALGGALAWPRRGTLAFFQVGAALLLVSTAAFFVTGRFRAAAVPFLMLLASAAPFELARARREGRSWIGWALAALALLALAHGPTAVRERAWADSANSAGCEHLLRGRLEPALTCLRAAVAQAPVDPLHRFNLGCALAQSGDWPAAEREFAAASAQRPDLAAEAQLALASARAVRGELELARAHVESALRASPDDPTAHAKHGLVLRQLGAPREAEAAYRRALAGRPHFAEVHNNLGWLLQLDGRTQEAIEHYELALALEPRLAPALVNLAWQRAAGPLARERDLERAERLTARLSRALGRDAAEVLDLRAACLAARGDFAQAARKAQAAQLAAERAGQASLADAIARRAQAYAAGRAWSFERAP